MEKLWLGNLRIITLFSVLNICKTCLWGNNILMWGRNSNNPYLYVVFPPLVRKLNPTSMYCEEINQIITAFMWFSPPPSWGNEKTLVRKWKNFEKKYLPPVLCNYVYCTEIADWLLCRAYIIQTIEYRCLLHGKLLSEIRIPLVN